MKWFLFILAAFTFARATFALEVKNACRPGESWDFGQALPKSAAEEYRKFVSGSSSTARAFAEGLANRRLSMQFQDSAVGKAFAEFWISRALFSAKDLHLAHHGFSVVARAALEADALPVQRAAIQCLGEIQKLMPSLAIPMDIRLAAAKGDSGSADALLLNAINVIGSRPSAEAEAAIVVIPAGAHADYARGMLESRAGRHAQAIAPLQAFEKNASGWVAKFHDDAKIMLGRALYAVGKYAEATVVLQAVQKSSNDLAMVLSDLTWSYLQAGLYEESVGVAMHLRAGTLKNTFAPEAPMVAAMAYNELCQFPASLQTINAFRKHYGPVYDWLKTEHKEPLYPKVLAFLKSKIDVPTKIASEWLRSPVFLSRQQEMNSLALAGKISADLVKAGAAEQGERRRKLTKDLREFIKGYKLAKINMKPGEGLSHEILDRFDSLKDEILHYRRFTAAAPVWVSINNSFEKKIPEIRAHKLAEIEKDFAASNKAMLALLDDVSENNQLIEVEIYNGASQDMVWKNAHADYEKVAKSMSKEDEGRAPADAWDWGRMSETELDDGEVWEDELGAAKADLTDNCKSKEKYMKIKRKKAR